MSQRLLIINNKCLDSNKKNKKIALDLNFDFYSYNLLYKKIYIFLKLNKILY